MLPKTFFVELAEKSPIVIFNNKLYQVTEDLSSKDFIKIGANRLGLIEADTLLNLENFYRHVNANEILNYKKKYIEGELNSTIKSREFDRMVSNYAVLDFLINGVFPYFNESEDGVDDLLEGKKIKKIKKQKKKFMNLEDVLRKVSKEYVQKINLRSKAKPVPNEKNENGEIIDKLVSGYYGVEVKEEKLKEDKNPRTLLNVALKDKNILTFYDRVYKFVKSKKSDISVVIDGQKYSLLPSTTIKNVDKKYKQELEKQFQKEAEEEASYEGEIREQFDSVFKQLGKFSQQEEYNEGDIGFIKKKDGSYWATLKVHPYVLKNVKVSYEDKFYKFGKCRVAIRIEYNNGNISYVPNPRVVERYSHPFLDSLSSWQQICMGRYNRAHLEKLDKASQIAALLSAAKNVLQSGYTETCNPYHGLGNYYTKLIPKSKIKNLPITNIKKKIKIKKKK